MKTRAAIYARYSTDRQDARSIDDQTRRCRRFAEERGYTVAAEYADAAVSGATLERAGVQRLLAAVRTRGAPFRVVLVDDLSRLSRDLGDTWSLVFTDLQGADIEVVDVTSRLSSADPHARLAFGAAALVNEMQRESVRKQTHRGLEGRALSGHATGGRCYGYRTTLEKDPADPLHPRAVMQIDPAEARVVRRIYRDYAGGASCREIARGLNRAGTPAPYDGRGYAKPAGRGWGHVTVLAMLTNERYVGRVVWNRRAWRRGRGGRRARLNDPRAWVIRDRPDLRIIDPGLWERVQALRADRRRPGTPRAHAGHERGPLSGLLVCGRCGARMVLSGQVVKRGRRYRNYRCGANRSKGPEVCANDLPIAERKALTAVAETIRQSIAHPRFLDRFTAAVQRLMREAVAERAAGAASGALDAAIQKQTAAVDRLAGLVGQNADIEALVRRLRAEEARLRELRAQRAALAPAERARAPAPPTAERLRALFDDVLGALAGSPEEARRALAARLGPIVLTPQEGNYEMRTTWKTSTAALVGGGRQVCSTGGCGGRI